MTGVVLIFDALSCHYLGGAGIPTKGNRDEYTACIAHDDGDRFIIDQQSDQLVAEQFLAVRLHHCKVCASDRTFY